MSLLLFVGLVGIVFVILFRNRLIQLTGNNNMLIDRLNHTTWFQNHWLSGIFLFGLNAFLFLLTGLILYLIMSLIIPFIHLFVMLLAVIASISLWIIINKGFLGSKRDRIILGAVGSSFYLFLTLVFIYMLVTLEPTYPGEDIFMSAVGLSFAIIVTSVALLTCFALTGFSRQK